MLPTWGQICRIRNKKLGRGTWGAHSVKHLTLVFGLGRDLMGCGIEIPLRPPELGFLLSQGSAGGSLSPSAPPPPHVLSLSCSPSNK